MDTKILELNDAAPTEKAIEENVNGIDGKSATTTVDKSLVYGIGAYAENKGKIEVEGTGIHVVSGNEGALYAKDYGLIDFKGYITHQNNIVNSSSLDIETSNFTSANRTSGKVSTKGLTGTSVVKRKGIVNSSITNDHENLAPFYVKRTAAGDQAAINFTGDTHIAMYDGILYTGNGYDPNFDTNTGMSKLWALNGNNPLSDYYKKSTPVNTAQYNAAKYRGMSNVTTYISDNKLKGKDGGVNVGLINQVADRNTGVPTEIEWDTKQAGGDGSQGYLKGIGTEYTGMTIKNVANGTDDYGKDGKQYAFYSTLINSELKITQDVAIENVRATGNGTNNTNSLLTDITGTNHFNDPFNNIALESNKITISNVNQGGTDPTKIIGDATHRDHGTAGENYQIDNVGLYAGNSLKRWDDINGTSNLANWRKTKKTESGITNKGIVDIWGGSKGVNNGVIGLLVKFGELKNTDNKAIVAVDHGIAMMATDGSTIENKGGAKVIASGMFTATATGTNSKSAETKATGENYGIVGISDTGYGFNGTDNSVSINHEDSSIYAAGDLAVGIYAGNKGTGKDKVTINYKNSSAGTTGIDVRNNKANDDSRGVGIALVNREGTNGGTITLDGGGTLANFANSSGATVTASTGTPA